MSETSVLERRTRRSLEDISQQPHHEGIYTQGREWEPHQHDVFLGVDAEQFYKTTTRRMTAAVETVGSGLAATINFIDKVILTKRWYLPAVAAAGLVMGSMYTTLMLAKPEIEIKEDASLRKRKKGPLEYWMKYLQQGKQKLKEVTGDSEETKAEK